IENRGLPNLRGIDAIPTLTEREATILAMNAYRNSPAHVLEVAIAIVPDATGTHGVLAWLVEIGGAVGVVHQLPIQEAFATDAHTGALIRRETTIHSFTDIKGETRQWAT